MAVKKVPEGHNRVSPYLIVDGAGRALDFYKKAFGAVELFRHTAPTGKIGHAEVRIGDTVVMLADVHPDSDAHGPAHYGGSPISLHMYVEDVDESEEHTSELQSHSDLVCRLLLEKKKIPQSAFFRAN